MIAAYGPDVILCQYHLTLSQKLYVLSLLQPVVSVLKERFIRGCESSLSPEKVRDHVLLLTEDMLEADRSAAWQKLNQMAR